MFQIGTVHLHTSLRIIWKMGLIKCKSLRKGILTVAAPYAPLGVGRTNDDGLHVTRLDFKDMVKSGILVTVDPATPGLFA